MGQIKEIKSLLLKWGSNCIIPKPMTEIKKTVNFGRNAIEWILKIKIAIENLIEQIKIEGWFEN